MRRRSGWKTVPRGIGVGKADSFRFVSAWHRRFGLVCVEQAARFVIQSSTSRACWRWCDGTRCACVTPARLNVLRSLEDASRCVDGFIKSGEMYDLDGWTRRDATRRIHPSVRRSLFLSFHSRAFPGRLRASSARPRAHRLCSISFRPTCAVSIHCKFVHH